MANPKSAKISWDGMTMAVSRLRPLPKAQPFTD
jgi:hypothetical protein